MLPKVVIVGRPNVGKSSLLNALAGRKISIVDPTAGVTRDRVSTSVELAPDETDDQSRHIELIDTGGYGIEDAQDLTAHVQRQIARAVAEADLVMFVVDGQAGVVPLDKQVASLLRQAGAGKNALARTGDTDAPTPRRTSPPIVLVVNKVDSSKQEPDAYEALSLGFDEAVLVSAVTGHNRHEIAAAIRRHLDFEMIETDARLDGQQPGPPPQGIVLAIVGKRNAGKSTFTNALVGDERVIVSDEEGTTRDSVDVQFTVDDQPFTAIDTAGVRRKKSVKTDIDYYSHHRSLRSIRRADVCLLLIDATVPVSQVDKQLAGEILAHHRPTVVVVSKWDLVENEQTPEAYIDYLEEALRGLNFAPIVFTSAVNGEGVTDALAMAENLYRQARHRIDTGELNRIVEPIMAERGPSHPGGKRAKVYYVTQPSVDPPTLCFFVNNPDLFDAGYQRFLENRLRQSVPFAEVPFEMLFRPRGRDRNQSA